MKNISDFEDIIGYKFNNKNYLRLALTHSSYDNEKGNNKEIFNERIEFLGDAVLEMISSSFLYLNYPDMKEGDLTKLRSRLVCEDALCDAAKRKERNLLASVLGFSDVCFSQSPPDLCWCLEPDIPCRLAHTCSDEEHERIRSLLQQLHFQSVYWR